MTLWVLDWKSSTGIYDEMRTQISCYVKMAGADKGGIVRLDKATGLLDDPAITVLDEEEIERRYKAFKYLREYYRIMVEPSTKSDHFYSYDGKKLPSPTMILEALNKPALVQWSANLTMEFFKANIRADTKYTQDQLNYFWKTGKTAYRKKSKEALDVGTLVHDAVHARLSGMSEEEVLETIIKGNEQVFNATAAFLKWKDEVKLQPIALEKTIYDLEIGIAGTPDFVGTIG